MLLMCEILQKKNKKKNDKHMTQILLYHIRNFVIFYFIFDHTFFYFVFGKGIIPKAVSFLHQWRHIFNGNFTNMLKNEKVSKDVSFVTHLDKLSGTSTYSSGHSI